MFKKVYLGNKEINKIFLGTTPILMNNNIAPPEEKTWVEWSFDNNTFTLVPYYIEYDTQQNLTEGQVVMQIKFTVKRTFDIKVRFLQVDGGTKLVSLGLNAVTGKTYILRAKYIGGEVQLWLQIDGGPDEYRLTTNAITTSYLGVAQFLYLKTLHFWTTANNKQLENNK